jgi:hypothetical protein
MKKLILVAVVFFTVFLISAAAHQQTDLDQVGDKLSRYIAVQMPGWQHKRGTPIQGSKDVVVETWTFPNRVVKISMMRSQSVEDARERLMKFAQEETDARELKGFGDQAYSWGNEGSNIIFRKGKYTLYVTTIADVYRDADAPGLSREQKRERRKSEMKRLSKEVAKHAAAAIDEP